MKDLFFRLKKVFSLSSQTQVNFSESVRSLLSMAQTIPFNLGLEETLSFLLNEFQKVFPVSCGIIILDEDSSFRIKASRGFSADFVERVQETGMDILNQSYSGQKEMTLDRSRVSEFLDFAPIFAKEEWKSLYLAPLTIQSQALGLFLAASQDQNFFNEKNIAALSPFLQVLCVGIRNCQLSDKMEKFSRRLEAEVTATTEELTRTNQRLIRRVWELKALYEITSLAATSSSLSKLCETVIPKLKEIFEAEFAAIFLKQSGKGSFVELVPQFPSFDLPKELQEKLQIQISRVHEILLPILETVNSGQAKVFSGEAVSLREAFSIPQNFTFSSALEKIKIRSYVALPLATSHGVLGAFVLLNSSKSQTFFPGGETVEPYGEEDIRTLSLIASQLSTAIDNLELDQENRRRLADLSTLHEISEIVYAKPIFEFNLKKICAIILESFSCDSCAFYFLDPMAGELVLRESSESADSHLSLDQKISLKEENHLLVKVFRNEKSQILRSEKETEQKPSSILLVPLKAEASVLGVLELRKNEPSFFNQHHLRLAELIAARVAALVQSVMLYEKILDANKELERLNRVKTEFVSMVSHELRTPMTAIKGFVDVVMTEEAGPVNEQQKRFLKIAHNSIDRLTLLISDLLDISRIESGKMKMELNETHLGKILREIAETYRKTVADKGITFHTDIDKRLPLLLVDEARIKQVVDNLLSNAIKFTASGGAIRVSADDMGDFVMVSVSDTGTGIKKENHEKIFEKFFQVDSSLTRQAGGTGLGLAISKVIIEHHGGRIWVESELGKGATFRFLLPKIRKGHALNYKELLSEKQAQFSATLKDSVSLKNPKKRN